MFHDSATGNMPHGGIEGQTLSIIRIAGTCKPAVYRRPEQSGWGVLGVLPCSNVTQICTKY